MSYKADIKLCVQHSCCNRNVFLLSDNTGPYDANLNPFGWGAGNIELSEVLSSGLTVISPSGVVYGPFDILSTLPNLDGTVLEIDIAEGTPFDIATTYEDGYWIFDWTVQGLTTGSSTSFHSRCVKQVLVLCDVQCCVDRLRSETDPTCGCHGKANEKADIALLTLETIRSLDRLKQREGAKKMLKNLQDLCGNKCKSC